MYVCGTKGDDDDDQQAGGQACERVRRKGWPELLRWECCGHQNEGGAEGMFQSNVLT